LEQDHVHAPYSDRFQLLSHGWQDHACSPYKLKINRPKEINRLIDLSRIPTNNGTESMKECSQLRRRISGRRFSPPKKKEFKHDVYSKRQK